MPEIARSLKRLKYKDLELEFDKNTKEVSEKLKQEIPETQQEKLLLGQTTNEVEERLFSVAELSPRAAILEAWLIIESTAVDLIRKKGISAIKSHPGPMRIRDNLAKGELLTHNQLMAFEMLRSLRNEAVHVADAKFSSESVSTYITSALKIAAYLEYKANEL